MKGLPPKYSGRHIAMLVRGRRFYELSLLMMWSAAERYLSIFLRRISTAETVRFSGFLLV